MYRKFTVKLFKIITFNINQTLKEDTPVGYKKEHGIFNRMSGAKNG